MNLNKTSSLRIRRRESGMAVIVILALVAIMMIYIAANLKTLATLHRDLNLIETKQVRRLAVAVRSAPASRPPVAAVKNEVAPASTGPQSAAQ